VLLRRARQARMKPAAYVRLLIRDEEVSSHDQRSEERRRGVASPHRERSSAGVNSELLSSVRRRAVLGQRASGQAPSPRLLLE
jgi:hypothetical protein